MIKKEINLIDFDARREYLETGNFQVKKKTKNQKLKEIK